MGVVSIRVSDDLFREAWNKKIPTREIARVLRVAEHTVRKKAKELGLPSDRGLPRNNYKMPRELFIGLWNAGVSDDEICERYGYASSKSVRTVACKLGLSPRGRNFSPKISIDEYLKNR